MKSKVAELLKELELLAPLKYQEAYDNAGLITGNPEMQIANVLLSLDCLETTIDEAIEKNCNVVLCHHPIIFKGLKSLTGKNYVERTIIKAIKNDVAIIAWHTNLDNVLRGGVNEKIASKLNLTDCSILQPKANTLLKLVTYIPIKEYERVSNALFSLGCGHIGNYSNCGFSAKGKGSFMPINEASPAVGRLNELTEMEELRFEVLVPVELEHEAIKTLKETHSYEEVAYEVYQLSNVNNTIGSGVLGNLSKGLSKSDFLKFVKDRFDLKVIKYTKGGSETIKRIAVCGGAGSFLIGAAKGVKADAFITSDIKYHEFFDAEKHVMICDIGHYESEISTLDIFHDVLSKKFTNFATLFTQTNTNPVNYYI